MLTAGKRLLYLTVSYIFRVMSIYYNGKEVIAMVRVVIEIADEVYEDIMKGWEFVEDSDAVVEAVKNGELLDEKKEEES